MTRVQKAARIFGWIFIVLAVLGFLWSGGSLESDVAQAPHALGLFAVNVWHNLFHLASGIWGLVAARRYTSARTYTRVLGVVYLALFVLGFFLPDLFGIMPIGGNDIWLHLLLGVGLAYFGFTARARAVETPAERRAA